MTTKVTITNEKQSHDSIVIIRRIRTTKVHDSAEIVVHPGAFSEIFVWADNEIVIREKDERYDELDF